MPALAASRRTSAIIQLSRWSAEFVDAEFVLAQASAGLPPPGDASARHCRLGIEHSEGLAYALLDGALDDFSQADLSEVNLSHIGLAGVRWSVSGTRWPPGLDVDALMQRSEETAPDSGIYVITRPGRTKSADMEAGVGRRRGSIRRVAHQRREAGDDQCGLSAAFEMGVRRVALSGDRLMLQPGASSSTIA